MGSLIGIVGSGLYLVARRIGGIFLFVGGVLASPLSFFIAMGAWPGPWLVLSFAGVLFVPSLLAAFLFIVGGLLCFPKTRHIIKGPARRRMDTLTHPTR